MASSSRLARQVGQLGVALAADRAVLPDRHRERSGEEGGQAGGEQHAAAHVGGGHADQEAGRREQPVVGAEHAGPQPAGPTAGVALHDGAEGACGARRDGRTKDVPDTSTLPRWDATALFPSLELAAAGRGPRGGRRRRGPAGRALRPPRRRRDRRPTSRRPRSSRPSRRCSPPPTPSPPTCSRLQVYVLSFVSTDSRNDAGQGLFSELERHDATMRQLSARFTAWVAALGPTALASASPLGADHAFALDRAGARAEHQMGPEEESLYAELRVDRLGRRGPGSTATSRRSSSPRSSARTARPSSCRSPRCGAWRPTPTPTCAGRPTTPSWRPGRPWRSPSRRR